jgi:two-component system copper resistance phosphate regulon response regulator CusR
MNILVVEDDELMADVLVHGLREESHNVDRASDGRVALRLTGDTTFDLILLDVMLPGMNGLKVAQQLRLRGNSVPVLMLTARDALADIVTGLDAGADDYLTKPFSFVELLARIRALQRRSAARPKNVLEFEDLVLDVNSHRAFRGGQEIYLSVTEFRLLELLVRNPGRVLSRYAILDAVWGNRRDVGENTVEAFVRLLRRKMEDDVAKKLIHTHRGFGYSVGCRTAS